MLEKQPNGDGFWENAIITSQIDCWNWNRPHGGHYPYVNRREFFPKPCPAHRVAYAIAYGLPPKGCHVCHKCGNRHCINPYHLYAGNAKTNHEDAVRHGTFKRPPHRQGEEIHNSKLSIEKILFIRRVYPLLKRREKALLAELMDITATHIRRIASGDGWDHVKS